MSNAESLYRLQLLDTDLDVAQKRLVEIEALLQGTPALAHSRAEVTRAEQELQSASTALRMLEMDAQSISEKIDTEEQRLYEGKIQSPKEMLDVQHELEVLKKRRTGGDDELLAAMERVETARADAKACRDALAHTERNFIEDNLHLKRERESLVVGARTHIEQKKALSATIAKDALDRYILVRAKKTNRFAVALIKSGACSQCGEITSSVSTQQARTGQTLAICSNCGRILYAQ